MAVFEIKERKHPPKSQVGIISWLKDNLFSSSSNILLTIVALYIIYLIVPPMISWIILDANFNMSSTNEQCGRDGACWAFIGQNINQLIYGFYPEEERWRVNLTFLLIPLIIFAIKLLKTSKYKNHVIISSIVLYPVVAFYLLTGGFGLEIVTTDKWGGLMLTLVIATVGIVASFPIGVLFALGRQSNLRIIRFISVLYIEFIRGVPLLTILFFASVILPLFFTSGIDMDKLLRALIGITLFQAAYIAEVVRGGLQAIPKGQYEAADALGLSYWQKINLIILPQALKISIPNITGSFISLFKDTTLVLIIGLFDVLETARVAAQQATAEVNWLGREPEGYVFVALIIWIILYWMSRYSTHLEHKLNTNHR